MSTETSFKQTYLAPETGLLELSAEEPLAQSQLEDPIINPPVNW